MEKIIPCKRYLEEQLGEPIDDSLEESCGDMKVISIKDMEVYHRLAQSLGISELNKKRNIYYDISLPDGTDWSIILSKDKFARFEQIYGSMYNIRRVAERPDGTVHARISDPASKFDTDYRKN